MHNQIFKNSKRSSVLFNKSTRGIFLFALVFLVIASCNNQDGNTGNNRDTLATTTDTVGHHTTQQVSTPKDGMTMIHEGMSMAKSGKEMMDKAMADTDKSKYVKKGPTRHLQRRSSAPPPKMR